LEESGGGRSTVTTGGSGGGERSESQEHLQAVATMCYSGVKDRAGIELEDRRGATGRRAGEGKGGGILVTRETNVVSDLAPARGHGRNTSLGI